MAKIITPPPARQEWKWTGPCLVCEAVIEITAADLTSILAPGGVPEEFHWKCPVDGCGHTNRLTITGVPQWMGRHLQRLKQTRQRQAVSRLDD